MYRIEVKELGKNKEYVLKKLKHITYKELYNLVKPYISEEHHDTPIGEILITYIEEER